MTIHVAVGDICSFEGDAIVNAANNSLIAGGGVCGAIHRAAGSELEQACIKLGKCETGDAVITSGFNLKARFVIHAVGPRWFDGTRGESDLLEKCYESIFKIAGDNSIRSIAIPAISTGIYNYPLDAATQIAVQSARKFDSESIDIVFACFSDEIAQVYRRLLNI